LPHSGKLFTNVYVCSFLHATLWFNQQGRTEGAMEAQLPGRQITLGALKFLLGRRMITGAQKCPNNVTRTFFNTVHLLPEDLRFENGVAKLASCPRRHL